MYCNIVWGLVNSVAIAYCVYVVRTAIPIIIEGQFQVFQRFSSSKLVLKAVESCFAALNYYGNGSMCVNIPWICANFPVYAQEHVPKHACCSPSSFLNIYIHIHIQTYNTLANTHTHTYTRIFKHACCSPSSFRKFFIKHSVSFQANACGIFPEVDVLAYSLTGLYVWVYVNTYRCIYNVVHILVWYVWVYVNTYGCIHNVYIMLYTYLFGMYEHM